MTQLHIVADFLLFWRQIQNFVVDELKKFYEPRKYHLYLTALIFVTDGQWTSDKRTDEQTDMIV